MQLARLFPMNKLKKPFVRSANRNISYDGELKTPATRESRTMTLARVAATVSATAVAPVGPVMSSPIPVPKLPSSIKPVTPAEQYWAARALTAEALLSVKATHQEEVRMLAVAEETKRSTEVEAVHRMHESRQTKLEQLAIALLTVLVALVAALLYMIHTSHSAVPQHRWLPPMHFTIPVLSPFASVVEHETSVIGSKMLTVMALIAAVLAYGCFRYWLTHRIAR